MLRILHTLQEVLPAAVVFLPLFVLLNALVFHSFRKTGIYGLFVLYLASVYILAGLPNITYIRLEPNVNLIPFRDFLPDLKNGMLNIALFLPLGFLLPVLWQDFRKWGKTFLFAFHLILVIELLQMLTFRATDINDLMTNLLGTWLGFLLAKVLMKKVPAAGNAFAENKTWEMYSLCAVVFFVMFFIHPFLTAVMQLLVL